MFKSKKKISEKVKNPILNHLEEDQWNEVQAYHIENESAWRSIAILSILALLLVTAYSLYLINQDKHKVIVFEKDTLGNITTLGIATKTFNIDNKIIAHQLANFIIALREAPEDTNIKRRNIDLVHKMTDPKIKSLVDQVIIGQYTRAKDGQISVDINNIKPIEGGRSWELRWTEKSTNLTNNAEGITHWDATVTFKRLNTLDPATQIVNPIGLFITYVNITQDVSDKG